MLQLVILICMNKKLQTNLCPIHYPKSKIKMKIGKWTSTCKVGETGCSGSVNTSCLASYNHHMLNQNWEGRTLSKLWGAKYIQYHSLKSSIHQTRKIFPLELSKWPCEILFLVVSIVMHSLSQVAFHLKHFLMTWGERHVLKQR